MWRIYIKRKKSQVLEKRIIGAKFNLTRYLFLRIGDLMVCITCFWGTFVKQRRRYLKRFNLLFSLGILIFIPLLNSCDEGDCSGTPTVPKNVVAIAGNNQVVISWQAKPLKSSLGEVNSEVLYQLGGGPGTNCTTIPKGDNCVMGCQVSTCQGGCSTSPTDTNFSCTVKGLTNGVAYTFTVVTGTSSANNSCSSVGYSYARSPSATPNAN